MTHLSPVVDMTRTTDLAGTKLDLRTPEQLGVILRRQVPLAPYTTIKIGGPADTFATVTTVEQLTGLVRWAQAERLPYFILGGGSNMLVSDAGIHGLVIHNRCRTAYVAGDHSRDGLARLVAESGAAMAGVARQTIREGIAGLEWAVSVPGTVGGAVVGNAGADGAETVDNLETVDTVDETGAVRELASADLRYAYRTSRLKQPSPLQAGFSPVVLSAVFRLAHADPDTVRQAAERYLDHRRRTQPVEPSLGSTFKNPPGDYAGRLIEAAGLKGRAVGGVEVSRVHANFFINRGGVGHATAADVVRLIQLVQDAVWERYNVRLEPEIQMAGEW